jgi:hypothetical protein
MRSGGRFKGAKCTETVFSDYFAWGAVDLPGLLNYGRVQNASSRLRLAKSSSGGVRNA